MLPRACVFHDQRATHRTECFPTLSRQGGKAKREEFSERPVISFHLSAAAGDASLLLSQPPTPEHQGRIFSGVPWQSAFAGLGVHECWSVVKKRRLKAQEHAIPLCRQPSKRGRPPAWLNRELVVELSSKKRWDDL